MILDIRRLFIVVSNPDESFYQNNSHLDQRKNENLHYERTACTTNMSLLLTLLFRRK